MTEIADPSRAGFGLWGSLSNLLRAAGMSWSDYDKAGLPRAPGPTPGNIADTLGNLNPAQKQYLMKGGLFNPSFLLKNPIPKPASGAFGPGALGRLFNPSFLNPSNIVNPAAEAAALPGDVYSGKTPVFDPTTGHTSDEAIKRSFDLAGYAAGVASPFAEEGAAGIFGGKLPHGMPKADALELEREAAARGAGSEPALKGLPSKEVPVDETYFVAGPNETARGAAQDYMKGKDYKPPSEYIPVDPKRAKRIAQAFDEMDHAPSDPRVLASYKAMANETMDQWQAIKKTGLKVEFIKPGMKDPYAASPRLANEDVRDNNHLWVFPTEDGFGNETAASKATSAENPLLADSGEKIDGKPASYNDIFRVVHDYFGHIKEGNGFRASGEDNAWRSHVAMYSPEARPAMTTETRGQNSWVNYGPHGDKNRTASASDTVYAPQKVGLMPDWVWQDKEPVTIEAPTSELPFPMPLPPQVTRFKPGPNRTRGDVVLKTNPTSVVMPNDARQAIIARGREMALPKGQRTPPLDSNLLDLSVQNLERTATEMPQSSRVDTPTIGPDAKRYPAGGRVKALTDDKFADQVANQIVGDIKASGKLGSNAQFFYDVYPIKEKLIKMGVPEDEAQAQIEHFGKMYASTSPRSDTENNLRLASFLTALEKHNPGLDLEKFRKGGLPTGYNQVLPLHTRLAKDALSQEGLNMDMNPKPTTFAANSAGNLADVTSDTHDIRSTLYAWNKVRPGSLPREWFKSQDAYNAYLKNPKKFIPSADIIDDKLRGQAVNKVKRQVEYGPMSDVTRRVAQKLGIPPAQAQSLKWFVYGKQTGLKSANKTLAELMQDRVSVTSQLTGMPEDEVFKKVMSGDMVLAANGKGGLVPAAAAAAAPHDDQPLSDWLEHALKANPNQQVY